MISKRELTVRNYYQFLNARLGMINDGLSQWQKQQQKTDATKGLSHKCMISYSFAN